MSTTASTKKELPEIVFRPSAERGQTQIDWLESRHTFSFGEYFDRKHMAFRSLRVINEDWIGPGGGFGSHPHKDMEILTYVLEGALKHNDSMGNGSAINAGDVQKMTAGTGIVHSEYNASKKDKVHLLQIWILPERAGLTPSYEQFSLPKPEAQKPLHLFASAEGGDGIIKMRQDVKIYRGILKRGERSQYVPAENRGVWIQLIDGVLEIEGRKLKTGDALSIENAKIITLSAPEKSEFLLFDLR